MEGSHRTRGERGRWLSRVDHQLRRLRRRRTAECGLRMVRRLEAAAKVTEERTEEWEPG
jgi:hypothetical protein